MIWTHVVLPLIVGLIATSLQGASAGDGSHRSKGNNSTVVKPGNKTHYDTVPLADNFLYKQFACRGKLDGLRIPIAGSCVDYYECQQEVAHRKSCSEGYQFSNHGLACLDARITKCQPEQLEVKCEGPCCGRSDGLYPAQRSCSDFLICVNGQTFHRSCGKVLQFSPNTLICDIPERARCIVKADKEIINHHQEEEKHDLEPLAPLKKPIMYMISHRVCMNQADGYTVPIYGSCNKFYLCVNGLGYLKSCGSLQFNPKKHFCDLKTRMYCPEMEDDDVIEDEDDYEPVQALPIPVHRPHIEYEDIEVGPPSVLHHHKPLTGKRPKPPVIEEEEDEELLDFRPQWGKKPAKIPVPVPEMPSLPESIPIPPHVDLAKEKVDLLLPNLNICADEPVGALMSFPGECSKFIRCRWDWYQRRVAEVMSCPDGMHFNPKSKYCDWPEFAGCKANSKKFDRKKNKDKF